MSEVINYGEGKRLQLLKNFNMSDESFIDNEIQKGKLDTGHLILKEVNVNGKMQHRWVDPNKNNKEHAEYGSRVELEHKGNKVTGTVGSVQKTGEYSIKLDKEHGGNTINKHPHQFDSPHSYDSEKTQKLQKFASQASDKGLQNTVDSSSSTPEMKELAQKEIEQRNGGKFGGLKNILDKKKQDSGELDLSDPDTKEMYDQLSNMSVPDLHDLKDEKLSEQEHKILDHVINEKTKTTSSERIQRYKDKLSYVMKTPHAHLFTYGTGGIGKTYNVKKAIEKQYGKNQEFDGQTMSYGSNDYKAAFLGKVTTADLYKQLYLHNGKTIIFDDADDILKDPVAVNMFKRAMDTSDSKLNWDSGGKLEKVDPVTGETITIPRDFKFDGKIIFISNKPKKFFTDSEDKRALLSRGDSLQMQFSNKETHDLLKKEILPQAFKGQTEWKVLKDKVPAEYDDDGNFIKYDTNSSEFKEFHKNLEEVVGLLDKHAKEIPEGELNGRTVQKLYGVYSHAVETNKNLEQGEKKRDPEKEVLASLRGSLSKSEEDELEKSFDDLFSLENDIEKAHKDVSHLEKKIITNKSGHQQTVYVRHHTDGRKSEFKKDDTVDYEHNGQQHSGYILNIKHHPKDDKYGTAIIQSESGGIHSKSLRNIDHYDKPWNNSTNDAKIRNNDSHTDEDVYNGTTTKPQNSPEKEKKDVKAIKVTGYKNLNTTIYETDERSITFEAKINGIPIIGHWQPISKYTAKGVEINKVILNDGNNYHTSVEIFNGGGSYKTYEIASRDAIKLKEKQPKDLSFTGRIYDTSGLKDVFSKKMKEIEDGKHDNILSEKFKKHFLNQKNDIEKSLQEADELLNQFKQEVSKANSETENELYKAFDDLFSLENDIEKAHKDVSQWQNCFTY